MDNFDKLLESWQRNAERKTKNKNLATESNHDVADNSVTKSNALIRAYYRFTLSEKRCMEALISKLNPLRTDNPPMIKLTAREYSKAYNVHLNHTYGQMSTAVDGLLHKVIMVRESERSILKINLTSQARYIKDEGLIEVKFNRDIYPHLVLLRDRFTSYPLRDAASFSSSYTWRFYELLASWAKPKEETQGYFAGWLKIEVDELRLLLGVPNSYRFDNFQYKVLDIVTKELAEKAFIHLQIERIKTSRKITHLKIQFVEDREAKLKACQNLEVA